MSVTQYGDIVIHYAFSIAWWSDLHPTKYVQISTPLKWHLEMNHPLYAMYNKAVSVSSYRIKSRFRYCIRPVPAIVDSSSAPLIGFNSCGSADTECAGDKLCDRHSSLPSQLLDYLGLSNGFRDSNCWEQFIVGPDHSSLSGLI